MFECSSCKKVLDEDTNFCPRCGTKQKINNKCPICLESKELLTQPLIVEGGKTLTIKAGSADAFTFGVSYLNIKKEVVT